ncbi:MAG: hypothetical protein HY290_17505 [Planctomycetia bacterium]|nr:hypothetical protein [Planctomycetia bacterium]
MLASANRLTPIPLLRLLCSILIDGFLGAICGGLFGFVFGGLGSLTRTDSGHLLILAAAFAICGAIAGALFGARELIPDTSKTASSPSASVSDLIGGKPVAPPTVLGVIGTNPVPQPSRQLVG